MQASNSLYWWRYGDRPLRRAAVTRDCATGPVWTRLGSVRRSQDVNLSLDSADEIIRRLHRLHRFNGLLVKRNAQCSHKRVGSFS
jgi:hypothetical protein